MTAMAVTTVSLSDDCNGCYRTHPHNVATFRYNVYAATVTEAEVDILTGQSQIIRADML